MKDNEKSGFFSWFKSTFSKKKIIYTDKEKNNTCQKEKKSKFIHTQDKLNQDITKSNPLDSSLCLTKHDVQKNSIELSTHVLKEDPVCDMQQSFFTRLKTRLIKTKRFFGNTIYDLFLSKKIDSNVFKELEEKMLLADMGIYTTERIIQHLLKQINKNELQDSNKVYFKLKKHMYDILKKVEIPLKINNNLPFIILVVGVNGTGKTTTTAKLAKKYKSEGKSVMLAAADTFRAGAIDQLKKLGADHRIPVISHITGSDPAAVAFDAIKSAISKKIDILIIDTAGRLHNKLYLMEELKKIVRVIKKIDSSAPHETLLIIDACNGQNTIQQTKVFHKELTITGIVLTKLDGTAKGGVIFALSDQFMIPIRYIGIGEKPQDLGIFDSKDFIDSIFL